MSMFFYPEPARGAVTKLDINGKGRYVRLDPGVPLKIKGEFKAQNPETDPTDTVQLILFLNDQFFKCIYNDVPETAPAFTRGLFSCSCTAPTKPGKYWLRAGWAYNWNWPDQAYKYIAEADPMRLDLVGELTIGPAPEIAKTLLPAALYAIPAVTIIGLVAASRKRGRG